MSPKALALLAVAVLLTPGAALAAHGKVGLWSSTTSMSMPGVPTQTHTTTYCMTPADMNADTPPADKSSGCSYQNVSVQGHTYTADMVCNGQFKSTGHIATTYDSDTHYKATISMAGEGFNMSNTVEGKWLKADCAGAAH